MSTLTALREKIEETKAFRWPMNDPQSDVISMLLSNQVQIMKSQAEILELLKGNDTCKHNYITDSAGDLCINCGNRKEREK